MAVNGIALPPQNIQFYFACLVLWRYHNFFCKLLRSSIFSFPRIYREIFSFSTRLLENFPYNFAISLMKHELVQYNDVQMLKMATFLVSLIVISSAFITNPKNSIILDCIKLDFDGVLQALMTSVFLFLFCIIITHDYKVIFMEIK